MAEKIITETTRYDYESGEIVRSEKQQAYKSDEPDYVKFYIRAWCDFKAIKGINTNFLYSILPYMSYANEELGQIISLSTFIKEQIAQKLGWKATTVRNRFADEFAKLCKQNVLKRVGKNAYQVNPELIGKGQWKDIRKLKATFNLETGEITHSYK